MSMQVEQEQVKEKEIEKKETKAQDRKEGKLEPKDILNLEYDQLKVHLSSPKNKVNFVKLLEYAVRHTRLDPTHLELIYKKSGFSGKQVLLPKDRDINRPKDFDLLKFTAWLPNYAALVTLVGAGYPTEALKESLAKGHFTDSETIANHIFQGREIRKNKLNEGRGKRTGYNQAVKEELKDIHKPGTNSGIDQLPDVLLSMILEYTDKDIMEEKNEADEKKHVADFLKSKEIEAKKSLRESQSSASSGQPLTIFIKRTTPPSSLNKWALRAALTAAGIDVLSSAFLLTLEYRHGNLAEIIKNTDSGLLNLNIPTVVLLGAMLVAGFCAIAYFSSDSGKTSLKEARLIQESDQGNDQANILQNAQSLTTNPSSSTS